VSGLIIDGTNAAYSTIRLGGFGPNPDHLRFIKNEIRFGKANGILMAGTGHEIINNNIHDCCSLDGNPPGHSIYTTGDNGLFDGNYIHDNGKVIGKVSGGLVQYNSGSITANNNVFRNNTITNEAQSCLQLFNGTGLLIYNNIVYNCRGGGI